MGTFADKSKEKELIEIWRRSFNDSVEYIQMFWDWNASKARIVVYEVDGKAVSVAYLLPVTYVEAGKSEVPCLYLYAAATLPEHRGHGYFGDILKFIRGKIPEPVILVPGETSLIHYYEKQGLYLWQEERLIEFFDESDTASVQEAGSDISVANYVSDISFEAYARQRDCVLAKAGYMKWDKHFMEYICHENAVCGGKHKQITIAGEKYIAMYRVENRHLKILELLPQTNVEMCVQVLMQENSCERATVCLQPNVMASENLATEKNKGYFNLTMG